MGDGTKIEWADATVNPINGCSLASPGCTNCYAMKQAHRFDARRGLTMKTKGGMVWTGEVRLNEKALMHPLSWRKPRRIFWNAHGDTFHERVPDEWIDQMFAVMALTPQHTHMVLTKRSGRMRAYLGNPKLSERLGASCMKLCNSRAADRRLLNTLFKALGDREREEQPEFVTLPRPNIWLGVSVEDQKRADERIPDLLATPAAKRFLSCEPLLGPVDLERIDIGNGIRLDAFTGWHSASLMFIAEKDRPETLARIPILPKQTASLDLVIIGGEKAHNFRDNGFEANARSLIEQCRTAGTAVFMKQMCGKPGKLPPIPDYMLIRELPA